MSRRARLITARVLVVLGGLLAVVAAFAGYVRYQAFDDSTFENTSQELIADPVIREQVAATMVETLFTNVDVSTLLADRLPKGQQGFAAPLAVALRAAADREAPDLLARPRPQELWVRSLSTAQHQLERVLDNKTTRLSQQGGYIVIDLRPLLIQLGDRVAIAGRLAQELPGDKAVIRIMKADQLQAAQDATHAFKVVAMWIWILPLLFWAIAIWLARGRRRIEVRAVALSIAIAGLIVLVTRAIAGRYVVDSLVGTESVKPAAENAWAILTALLADGGRTLLGVGIAGLIGVWLVGPSARATAARRWLGPYIANPWYAYGGGALLLLLVVWWGPTAQTRRLLWVTLLAILLAAGIELLRRQTARELA